MHVDSGMALRSCIIAFGLCWVTGQAFASEPSGTTCEFYARNDKNAPALVKHTFREFNEERLLRGCRFRGEGPFLGFDLIRNYGQSNGVDHYELHDFRFFIGSVKDIEPYAELLSYQGFMQVLSYKRLSTGKIADIVDGEYLLANGITNDEFVEIHEMWSNFSNQKEAIKRELQPLRRSPIVRNLMNALLSGKEHKVVHVGYYSNPPSQVEYTVTIRFGETDYWTIDFTKSELGIEITNVID